MKKILAAILLCVFGTSLNAVSTHSIQVMIGPGHVTTPACASGLCDGTADSTTGIFDISGITGQIYVTAYCVSGPCTGTINVQLASKANSPTATNPPLTTLVSCTNPDATTGLCADGGSGQMYVINTMRLQVQQSGTGAGTFGVILESSIQ